MKLFYTFLLLFSASFLFSQTLEITPAQGNPVLQSFDAKRQVEQATFVKQLAGINPLNLGGDRGQGPCPTAFNGYLLPADSTIIIKLDTFNLMNDSTFATLTVLNGAPLQFGTAEVPDSTINLVYTANPNISGFGTDTVYILFSQPSDNDTIRVIINVKRTGRTIVASPLSIDNEDIVEYCLDDELDFPMPISCSRFLDCNTENYDGEGNQLFHFTNYNIGDPCFVYYASRFPGTDTVCVVICDEATVCDTFKIPFNISGETLILPFFDDFSQNVGPYPSAERWLDEDVYINSTLAKDPPSVGFATFDGLDRHGKPYPITGGGRGDRLTSKPIDLSGVTSADGLTLKFFVAPKGYGTAPERRDSLVLEFRNNQKQWILIDTFFGFDTLVSISTFPPFVFKAYQFNNTQFYHNAFQFRFTNYVSPGGAVDLWHVDYVRLAANEGVDDDFPDIAFTQLPSSILKNYTSMPWRHFDGFVKDEVTNNYDAHFFNHGDLPVNLGISKAEYFETTTGTTLNQPFTLNESGENFDPKVHETREGEIPSSNFTAIKDALENISTAPFRNILTEFSYVQTGQSDEFFVNDTVRLNTPFDNYFAHDDGTAEWQAFIRFADGNEILASKFHANVDDSLRAVRFMFPHVNGDVQGQFFNIKIWTADPATSDPVFEQESLQPFYASNVYDTLQGFTTYRLEDINGNPMAVAIPKGDFYIGFQQAVASALGIPLGLDIQNPCACNLLFVENHWSSPASLNQGALMIRPVVGDFTPNNTSSHTNDEPDAVSQVAIFPNPTSGVLNFSVKTGSYDDYNVMVFNNIGQVLLQKPLSQSLDLSELKNGVYFVQLQNEKTGSHFYQKIILAKK